MSESDTIDEMIELVEQNAANIEALAEAMGSASKLDKGPRKASKSQFLGVGKREKTKSDMSQPEYFMRLSKANHKNIQTLAREAGVKKYRIKGRGAGVSSDAKKKFFGVSDSSEESSSTSKSNDGEEPSWAGYFGLGGN